MEYFDRIIFIRDGLLDTERIGREGKRAGTVSETRAAPSGIT
jgi:hypothetical protein